MMTEDAYHALRDAASMKIGRVWALRESERGFLSLVNDLSYALCQSWALMPCLQVIGDALGMHRSSVSRAVRRLVRAGVLQRLETREGALYRIMVNAEGVTQGETVSTMEAARKRLHQMNVTRRAGEADGDGQIRLPGVLPSEELDAPAEAFEVMKSPPLQAADGDARPRFRDIVGQEEDDLQRALRSHAEDFQKTGPPGDVSALLGGLSGEQRHALIAARDEMVACGSSKDFLQWGWKWKQRALKHPRALAEAVGWHKVLRKQKKPAKKPGAWICRTMQNIVDGVPVNDTC